MLTFLESLFATLPFEANTVSTEYILSSGKNEYCQ